ncbi:NAC domain-containing protein 91-like [Arachis stenosperma]|uniref:NAC domain-containing protein 91-like n=1 Tax=Arachis stenosperma TaxID=217475 RepID=UPI0025AD0E0C|nr:NAC domain-containing protein 91-like [Arachis stenosperma]
MAELSAAATFTPSDEELIHFLSDKVKGQSMDEDAAINIHECEYLYGRNKNPWDIWRDFAGDVDAGRTALFFFSPNKKHHSTASRPIGAGVWEAEAETIDGEGIVGKGKNRRIGTKKCFIFDKSGTSYDGAWILHEYTLHGSSLHTNTSVDNSYVICKLIKNVEGEAHPVEVQFGDKRKRHAQSATTSGVQIDVNAPHSYVVLTTCHLYFKRNTKEQEVQFIPNELGRRMLLERKYDEDGLILSFIVKQGLPITNENLIRNLMQLQGGTRRGGKGL